MQLIYVDDEKPALDNFKFTVADFQDVSGLEMFQDGDEALSWAKDHKIDVAFLDMEMNGIHGLELARRLKQMDENIRIIFVTAYSQYALEAFGVDAIGYILKPYTKDEVRKELDKAARIRPLSVKRVRIETIPNFVIYVDGEVFRISNNKSRELLALLVDRAEMGITTGEVISCLWPERPNDNNSQTLTRMTFKRLMDTLKEAGIDNIVASKGRKRYLVVDQVECDLYKILSGDREAGKAYAGQYLREYSWAEERNGQLSVLLRKRKVPITNFSSRNGKTEI